MILGISNTLEDGTKFHMVAYDQTTEEYSYLKFDSAANLNAGMLSASKMYSSDIFQDGMREAVFVGSRPGTIGSEAGIK